MKIQNLKSFLAVAFVAIVTGCASTTPYQPTEVAEVVEIPGQSQEQIYNKSRQWFSQYFVSGESVVDYEDKSTGTIIGNGIALIGTSGLGIITEKIEYNLRIDTKDGRLRALTTINKHTNTDSTNGTYTTTYVPQDRVMRAEAQVKGIVADLKKYITSEKNDVNSNW